MDQQKFTSNSIYRWPTVKAITGLSRSTCWRLQKTGDFPKSINLSSRAIGWLQSDIEQWIESRAALQPQEAA